jgi:hypothetical protein
MWLDPTATLGMPGIDGTRIAFASLKFTRTELHAMPRFFIAFIVVTAVMTGCYQEKKPADNGGIKVDVPGVKVEVQTNKTEVDIKVKKKDY